MDGLDHPDPDFPNKDAILAELLVQHIDRGTWTQADQLDLAAGSIEAAVRALVRDAIDNHRDDPQLLRIMIEQAPMSQELLAAIDRHGKLRVGQVRALLARHPDVHVRDLDTPPAAAHILAEIGRPAGATGNRDHGDIRSRITPDRTSPATTVVRRHRWCGRRPLPRRR